MSLEHETFTSVVGAGAFGMSDGHEQTNEESYESSQQQSPAPRQAGDADPFAFDAGAFGFSGEEQPQADLQQPQQPDLPARTTTADPFAFDSGAFGLVEGLAPADPGQLEEEDQSHPEIVPADTGAAPAPAQAADPFAFDAGAFGTDFPPQQGAASRKQTSQRRPTSAKAAASGNAGSEEDNLPLGKHKHAAAGTSQTGIKQQQIGQQRQGDTAPSSGQRSAPKAGALSQPQIYRPRASKAPEPDTSPLTSADFQELQHLLTRALAPRLSPLPTLGLLDSPTTAPMAGLVTHAEDSNPMAAAAAALPPGLTAQQSITMLNIAYMLCNHAKADEQQNISVQSPGAGSGESLVLDRAPVDWAALDAPAQKVVRSVQLATCATHTPSGKASTTPHRLC